MTDEIWSFSAVELAQRARDGELSARAIVDAFVRRIEVVNPAINAVVVPQFAEARRDADAADRARARGDALGALHGVPFTVKECFHVAGTRATAGVDGLGVEASSADADVVAALRRAGAILLGKTNLPQLVMGAEADNPVYGRTRNPWNLERAPGGSSGGEGAILAAMGAPLGLGTDIGGSVRTPAHACGVSALKPSAGRLSLRGTVDEQIFGPFDGISEQPGPMARSVDDLALAFRVLTESGAPTCVRLAGLRVGLYEDDGHFTPSPAIRRAVREAARALERAGCVVVPFAPPAVGEAMAIYTALMCDDAGARWRALLGKSRRSAGTSAFLEAMRVPGPLKAQVARLAQRAGQRHMASALGAEIARGAAAYADARARRDRYAARFMAALDALQLDALLCPPFGLPALLHGSGAYVAPAMSYAAIFNLLGLPAGVVAASRVRPDEESDRRSSLDGVELLARRIERRSAGLPVGVQIAGRHAREDVVLALMKVVEDDARSAGALPRMPTALRWAGEER